MIGIHFFLVYENVLLWTNSFVGFLGIAVNFTLRFKLFERLA